LGDFIDRPGISLVIDKVAQAFRENRVHIKRSHKILFVCGGTKRNCIRSQFIEYANLYLENFHIFRAEDTFEDLEEDGEYSFLNLSDIEKIICEVADSVVIFPESEGSYAEIGLFSGINEISEKTLVANRFRYQASNSFLNIGPIHDIQKNSVYGQVAYLQEKEDGDVSFDAMPEMLKRTKGKKTLSLHPDNVSDFTPQTYFYIVMLLVYIFPIITAVEVSKIIKLIFKPVDYRMLKQYLSMLCGAKYIARNNDYYFVQDGKRTFFQIEGWEVEGARADILSVYSKEAPDAFQLRQ